MGPDPQGKVTEVFCDASFWVALRNRREVNHLRALEISREFQRTRRRWVVTPFIFAEVHAYFSRATKLRAQIIAEFWENPVVRMEQVTRGDQLAAIDLLRAQADKEYSFCDACSFVLMERLGLSQVASFDGHFRHYGRFEVID